MGADAVPLVAAEAGALPAEGLAANTQTVKPFEASHGPSLVFGIVRVAVLQSFCFGFAEMVINNSKVGVMLWFTTQGRPLSEFGWSLVVALFPLGGLVGAASSGVFLRHLGYRTTRQITNMSVFCSGVTLLFTRHMPLLCSSYFLAGVAAGLGCSAVPLFIADAQPEQLRGSIDLAHELLVGGGALLASLFSMNAVLHNEHKWYVLYALCLPISLFHFAAHWLFPDHPRILYSTGWAVQVREPLVRKANILTLPSTEKQDAPAFMFEDPLALEKHFSEEGTALGMQRLLGRENRKSLKLLLVLDLAAALSCTSVVSFYSNDVFNKSGLRYGQSATLCTSAIYLLANAASAFCVKRVGHRFLLLLGFGTISASYFAFFLCTLYNTNEAANLMALYFITLAVAAHGVGPGTLYWMVINELFGSAVRPYAALLSACNFWLGSLSVALLYPHMQAILGQALFAALSLAALASFGLVYTWLPDSRFRVQSATMLG